MSDKQLQNYLLGLTGVGLLGTSAYLWNQNKKETNKNSDQTELTILSANDIYELEPIGGVGGLAELTTILKQERLKSKNHITTINGDFLAATSLSNVFMGAHMVHVMNEMKVDYVAIGNHEFDYGPLQLKKRIKESKFDWIATNVLESDAEHVFEGCLAHKIIDVDGFKVGIFGVCTDETRHLSYPADTVFADVVATSQKAVEYLQSKGVDAIIALTHQSLPEDQILAKKVPAINLILGGHEHSPFSIFEGETFIHKSGQNGNYLGRIDMKIAKIGNKSKVFFTYKMIPNVGYEKDVHVQRVIDQYMHKLEELKKVPLANVESFLESKTEGVRARETSMGNLLADAVRQRVKTDIAIVQGGAIRGDHTYPSGSVFTAYDLNRELPFGNSISMYKIKGSDLWQGLEEGIRYLPNRAGCFPQVSGLTMVIDAQKNPGSRIQEIKVHGEKLDNENFYTVASTTFIRNGGDGYTSLTRGEAIDNPDNGMLLSMIFKEYLEKNKVISAPVEDRILIL